MHNAASTNETITMMARKIKNFPQYALNSNDRFLGELFGRESFKITKENSTEDLDAKNKPTRKMAVGGIRIMALNAIPLS